MWAVYAEPFPSFGVRYLFSKRGLDYEDAKALFEEQCAVFADSRRPTA